VTGWTGGRHQRKAVQINEGGANWWLRFGGEKKRATATLSIFCGE
jgi:hypothetical protein